MKKYWQVSVGWLTAMLLGWLAIGVVLACLIETMGWWPLKVALFITLVFLPGAALLRVLRIRPKTISAGSLFSFGLSVLVLMLAGLAANEVLPLFGVLHPLETSWALGVWSISTLLIIGTSYLSNPYPLRIKKPLKRPSVLTWVILLVSLLLPFLAMAGAFRLNNGADATITMVTLWIIVGLIIGTFLFRRRLPDGLLVWLVFSVGLAVLLMTSLRGWDITGHDIEREFRVYTMTHAQALWNIALDRDPYNACLSITILPEMFSRLLDVSGLIVFKLLLQLIFAACPAVIYVLLRQYVPKLAALSGSFLFICYPTFINDSAMLTRQGIAYLFFSLALLILSNKAQEKRHKLLFLLCSLGAILSHYSTAYMFVGLFVAAVICKLLLTWWRGGHLPLRAAWYTVLSPLFAVLLFGMTFIWYSQITGTSAGLVTTLSRSFASIPNIFSSDNKSSDTSSALIFASAKTQADLYQSYLTTTRPKDATAIPSQYTPTLTGDDLPLTSLGKRVRTLGINPSMIAVARQNFAKVLQVVALLGVIYVAYKLIREKHNALELDFVSLSVAGIGLLILMVILPVLSINYGVLRAFQQALIFLVLPMMLLLVEATKRMNIQIVAAVVTSGMGMLFLLFTGVFAQLLGGASPSLSMNNRGLYYELYYSTAADVRGFAWLKEHIPKDKDVRVTNFNRAEMHDPMYPFTRSGILPSQIGSNTYVYLDQAQVLAQKVYAYYESSPLIITFPSGYYTTTKNQIYSTTSTRIYR